MGAKRGFREDTRLYSGSASGRVGSVPFDTAFFEAAR